MSYGNISNFKDAHAFLSPSNPAWLNYDDDKLRETYYNKVIATKNGTELHELAEMLIKKREKLQPIPRTFNMYVNDAIDFNMDPEVRLTYSDICFGTADALCFENGILRIHDLKTGINPAHMDQLRIYASLFCFQYAVNPNDIYIELRIYQNDDINIETPTIDILGPIMSRIVNADRVIDIYRAEVS